MNPVVVICTHGRFEITCKNIRTLYNQSRPPKIVLVVSDAGEQVDYNAIFPEVSIVRYPNVPLGAKWQAGVNEAVRLKADPLIITGSDDILCNRFVEDSVDLLNDMDLEFIGLRAFWVHHKGKAHFVEYKPQMPIGGGRVYTAECLKKLKNELFDTRINKHLDDLVWKKMINGDFRIITTTEQFGLAIHAVKGDWAMMNPFNPNHPNIKIIRTDDSIAVLPELYS